MPSRAFTRCTCRSCDGGSSTRIVEWCWRPWPITAWIPSSPTRHTTLRQIVKRFGTTGLSDTTQTGQRARDRADGMARLSRGFMGQTWDGGNIAFDPSLWAEVLRVLKPGGHLLAFSGSRTYHRMACAIEDAGFEIRDQIMWLYGSGFPKSHDISKAIDKAVGAEREVVGTRPIAYADSPSGYSSFSARSSAGDGSIWGGGNEGQASGRAVTAPATDAAREWEGWGTALKPAHEPIVMARKPLAGTVVDTVLAYGTGGLNIDGCRIEANDAPEGRARHGGGVAFAEGKSGYKQDAITLAPAGRFPANVMHDGSDEVVAGFPMQISGGTPPRRNSDKSRNTYGAFRGGETESGIGRTAGNASRFFYCAKASKSDRGEGNEHPTVKPESLMRYLVRLVTPPGGLVFDPFTGSGSTGKAAMLEGFRFLGAELTAEYIPIARARIAAAAARD